MLVIVENADKEYQSVNFGVEMIQMTFLRSLYSQQKIFSDIPYALVISSKLISSKMKKEMRIQ